MICPKCKTKDNFKIDKSSIYCIAKNKRDKICGYTLTADEKNKYRKQLQGKKQSNKKTKEKILLKNGLTLLQIAKLNKLHVNTVRKHLFEFDEIPGSKPKRYKYNTKLFKDKWSSTNFVQCTKTINFHGYVIDLDENNKPIL